MGIPHYFHVITKNYPNVLHTVKPTPCDHYFLDFNGLIHHAAHELIHNAVNKDVDMITFEKQIVDDCWKYLMHCVEIAKPSSMVHICIDGVAPVAKMNQQRKRRFLSIFQKTMNNVCDTWDTNAISPGTEFMARLKSIISSKIRDTPSKCIFFLSGADEPGEGEHKIMARIASLRKTENIYIYGLDADLIMLSLISHHPHIYLMREPQHTSQQVNVNNTVDGFVYLDIHSLRIALIQELRMSYNWPLSDDCLNDPYCDDAKNCIETYIVMCFLLGNDFLPHIPTLSLKKNGHTCVLNAAADAWKTYNSPCVENGVIHAAFIGYVLDILKNDETTILLQMNQEYYKKRPFASQEAALDKTFCWPIQDANKDQLAEVIRTMQNPENTWRSMYYKYMFYSKLHDTQIIVDSSNSYIQGIYWTYAYYKRMPKDSMWYYPYGYSPTLFDVSNNINASINLWDSILHKWKETGTCQGFVDPIIQLLSILPFESRALLPFHTQKIFDDPKYGCAHMFPQKYPIQTYLKTHLWECSPVLPPLDILRLKYGISLISI
jgi:5'-3' exoribonuclease 1